MAMRKVMVAMTEEMVEALEKERKARKVDSVPEVVRQIIGDYLRRS
ncbi:MAG: ribbon-helix-helix protein, CopG family [Halobacteriales archaeon]|nr:ribbon-helix-helix protein, CopG family [Halobacteriales archaeon]